MEPRVLPSALCPLPFAFFSVLSNPARPRYFWVKSKYLKRFTIGLSIETGFQDPVILQITKPVTVNVAAADYEAQKLDKFSAEVSATGEKKPFILAHDVAVTLKVQTWKGDVVTWKFPAGPYPMLLRKIFTDGANTATSIQIAY